MNLHSTDCLRPNDKSEEDVSKNGSYGSHFTTIHPSQVLIVQQNCFNSGSINKKVTFNCGRSVSDEHNLM